MITAKIYQLSKSATQSGQAKSNQWRLEFTNDKNINQKFVDPIMGWTGIKDTAYQVQIDFNNLEEAKEFAHKNGLAYIINENPKHNRLKPRRSYSDNFAFTKRI